VSDGARLFFGVGVGRCGTMAIANALAAEAGVVCTHEGKVRHGAVSGKRVLPFLTLENRIAYEWPERAVEIFGKLRGDMPAIAARAGAAHLGDIAYNYAPFVPAIGATFPEAKLIVIVRNCVDFVRSATQADGEDPTPVGWSKRDKVLSAVERYVELGRLAPRQGDPLAARWDCLDHLARNAWLWAETNRLIVEALANRPPGGTYLLRFEEFFRDARTNYRGLRDFLQLNGEPSATVLATFDRPINRRAERILGPPETWASHQRAEFEEFAGEMMHRLGYDSPWKCS
jgi:hypothetical protein